MTTSPSEADGRTIPETTTVDDSAGYGAPTKERPLLRRSSTDKVIAGVAGGLGRYLGVDPVVIRIALVVFALSGGAGVLLYVIAWIAIAEERPGELPPATRPDRNNGAIILGAVLLAAGGLLFAERLVPNFSSFMGPLVLVGLGAALVLGARR